MPLKVNVGLSQKIGLPDYGSLGASCHVEYEADSRLLQHDLAEFQRQVQAAFMACKQAVQDELHRHAHNAVFVNVNITTQNGKSHPTPRKATSSQVRAIQSIANRLQIDINQWLQQKYGLQVASELSIGDASKAIDELKQTASSNTPGAY